MQLQVCFNDVNTIISIIKTVKYKKQFYILMNIANTCSLFS